MQSGQNDIDNNIVVNQDAEINDIVTRIYNQRKFINELAEGNSKCSKYFSDNNRIKSYSFSLSRLFLNENIAKDYEVAYTNLSLNIPAPFIRFFKQHPDFLNFFVKNFHVIETASNDYQQRHKNLIELLEMCKTESNKNSILAIANIINGENIELTEEIKLLLKTPAILYAFASLKTNIYIDQIPKILRDEINKKITLLNRYRNMHDDLNLILNNKSESNAIKSPSESNKQIAKSLAYSKLQQEIENNLYKYTKQQPFTYNDLKYIDEQFISNYHTLLPAYILKLTWTKQNTAVINFIETAMLNENCTKNEAQQYKEVWNKFQSTHVYDITSIKNLINRNPDSLFNTLEFKTTIEFSLLDSDELLQKTNIALEKQIALKEINRRLLENNPDLLQALEKNPAACRIIRDNLTPIAKRFYEKTKKYYLKHYNEYLAANKELPENFKPLAKVDIDLNNNTNERILFNSKGGTLTVKILPETTSNADNNKYNKLINKLNPAARILMALSDSCNLSRLDNDNDDFNAIIRLRNNVKQATSSPGIAELNNPRNPDADTLLVIVKEVAIFIGFVILTPLIIPVPFLIAALIAHSLFPKQPEGSKVVQSRNDTMHRLGLNQAN